jgi:hypothetical protein
MVVERFRNRDPVPVYARFRAQGRLAPDSVLYINSWVSEDLASCFQVMECDSRAALDRWIENWTDLVEFEVIPVVSSAEASVRVPAL